MSLFSDNLKKYYTRTSNKVVFSNGMTLNQLATEMWEDLEYASIDSSVLSKVINGQRVFSPAQVRSFCKILKLTAEDADLLLVFAISSKSHIADRGVESFISQEYLDLVDMHVRIIPFLRSEGAMQHARELAFHEESVLKRHMKKVKTISAERVFLRALSRLSLEQSRNISDTADYGKGYPKMLPLIRKLQYYASKISDSESYSRAHQSKGDAFYNIKKYQLAGQCFKLAAENTTDLYWKLEALRALALCLARIGEKSRFQHTVDEIEDLISSGKFSDPFFLITVYEALGRSFAFFQEESSFELLAKAIKIGKSEEDKGRLVVLPKIQIIRSKLTAYSLLPHTECNTIIEKTSRIGLTLSNSYKYTRQEKEIDSLRRALLET